MTGPISGDYYASAPGASSPVQQFLADLNALRNFLKTLPPDSPYAKFLQAFITSGSQYFGLAIHEGASQQEVQNFINNAFSGGNFYLRFANGDWSNPNGYLNAANLQKMAAYLQGYSLPPIPPMSDLDQMVYDILETMGQAPPGSALQKLYQQLAAQLFSNGPIDPGTFLNIVLPWMQQVIQGNFAGFPGLTGSQKTEFIQNFYSNYIGLLEDWGNPNAADFIKQLEAIFADCPNGLPPNIAQMISALVNAALSHNSNDPNFLTDYQQVMVEALMWDVSCPAGSYDRMLADLLLTALGTFSTLEELREWAVGLASDETDSWVWKVSQDGLTKFGELTGALMTAKQYQKEIATWLKAHANEKGSPLYNFAKWIDTLIKTFQTQNPGGNLPALENYLDGYISSDIYKMFPGLTFAEVSAFYGSDMPPHMVPPPQSLSA